MANRFQNRSGTTTPDNTDLLDREIGVDTSEARIYIRIGSAVHELQVAEKNTSSTSNPTVNDDNTQGYIALRSMWHNTTTDKVLICTDASTGAATWLQLN